MRWEKPEKNKHRFSFKGKKEGQTLKQYTHLTVWIIFPLQETIILT